MSHPRKLCIICNGPKEGGRGQRVCNECRVRRIPEHRRAADCERRRLKNLREVGAEKRRPHSSTYPEGQSWCARCRAFLPVADFGPSKTRANGLNGYCRVCFSEYTHERLLRHNYNITLERYYELLDQQNGRCAICQCQPRKRRLSVDHDHDTGEVRGLLCTRCNQGLIGTAQESAAVLLRAARYLDSPPARTGLPPADLGEWDSIRLEAYVAEAEAKSDQWTVVIPREGHEPRDWFVVTDLATFARLLSDDEAAS